MSKLRTRKRRNNSRQKGREKRCSEGTWGGKKEGQQSIRSWERKARAEAGDRETRRYWGGKKRKQRNEQGSRRNSFERNTEEPAQRRAWKERCRDIRKRQGPGPVTEKDRIANWGFLGPNCSLWTLARPRKRMRLQKGRRRKRQGVTKKGNKKTMGFFKNQGAA